nr:MFS transporter [uncultured Blautia sp.]
MNKERTILYLFSINAIIYIASGFYTPFLSAYYAQKGIDAEKIGILLMIGPCVVLLTQRFWAKISDRTGKRKEVLLVTIVGSGFSMLLYYLGNSFLCMFFATVVVTSFTTAVIPLSDAILIARSLKEGYSYSIIRLGGTLGYAVMTICAGMYLKTRPQMQFVFAFFAYMILFCFCIGLKEERNGQIVINEVVQENEQNRIFKNRDVYIVLGLAFVSQMGLSVYYG